MSNHYSTGGDRLQRLRSPYPPTASRRQRGIDIYTDDTQQFQQPGIERTKSIQDDNPQEAGLYQQLLETFHIERKLSAPRQSGRLGGLTNLCDIHRDLGNVEASCEKVGG